MYSYTTTFPQGRVYVNFLGCDVTNPGGPYQPFVVVLFFKSKYIPLI